MDASNLALTPETLLEHQSFVRSVARGLLRDEHAAEDVAQDTWLAALGRFPGAPASLRGWLGTVARNRARDARRRTVRRDVRERGVARAEATPAVDAAFERLSVQRDVVSAILELDEPYRSVVILRYYHDLEPVEIARRLKANPATVRTQLVRAHEHLRRKLDARHGRDSWAALLLGGAGRSAWTGAAGKAAVLCAGLAGSAGAVWWTVRTAERPLPILETVAASLVEPRVSSEPAVVEPAASPTGAQEAERQPVLAQRSEVQEAEAERIYVERSPRAELFTRGDRSDYGKSVFSFEHGLRDDPENEVTRNDWDVYFDRDDFDVKTVVDDQSIIIDLGAGRLADLTASPITRQIVEATALFYALADEKQKDQKQKVERAEAILHHTYFVWTRDSDSNLVSAFEVVELAKGERCVLDWFSTRDGRFARASAELAHPEELARTLLEFRTLLKRQVELKGPSVVLQGRNGAGGGNPYRVNLAGELRRFDALSKGPLDLSTASHMNEDSVAYVERGGFIQEGQVFIVHRVTWSGSVAGDSNGRGGFRVVLKDLVLAEREIRPDRVGGGQTGPEEPIQGVWTGRVELFPGDEKLVFLELRNSSKGEVVFQGSLEPRPR